ncbi:alkaline phosphatase family protein [Endozoicomonas sp. G2_1]|uniref:alkaline phosphatase D family protein n=1 Tax=Endozoicomonas sp. G2_1 TaxID=2821091 RepID=UPI001ADA07C4|nr:alkaline phosphatase D family protein [Endozoicomonas sp. G2_1]MBO9490830.1 alkaline phosphatase family protein [Endozoicomonas sp. G2_1]
MTLAPILAGPILRRTTADELVIWWVSPTPWQGQFSCYHNGDALIELNLNKANVEILRSNNTELTDNEQAVEPLQADIHHYRVGKNAVIHLLHLSNHRLPLNTLIEYDLTLAPSNQEGSSAQTLGLKSIIASICYPEFERPNFVIKQQVNNLLHGSCRNPHHYSDDTLLAGEEKLKQHLIDCDNRPSLTMMSGDQIYADHVAGSTLNAIHQVIELLGLYDENFDGASISDSRTLHQEQPHYYQRELLLPLTELNASWWRRKKSAIFTSVYAHNHLVSFAEMMAMYLLVWSPTLWSAIKPQDIAVPNEFTEVYRKEKANIEAFVKGLDKVQRLLAHTPTYMIFDDHDVTDDWNLTAGWEQAAYQQPFANRIIGNALFAYWLCQGWGNDPKKFGGDFAHQAQAYNDSPTTENQQAFINYLYKFQDWDFIVDTSPAIVVLDSRTQRWRSESSLNKPSGLMDWEALCQLQQHLLNKDAVVLVSPAPMFGVKLIEAIQKLATIAGQPLAVDAENWMAHPGAANTLLNIFRHPKTPQHFIILSGDVHYSFAYDIEIRFRQTSPKIWQITSSGVKNQFPMPFIGYLDKLNRLLYGVYSPLNLFTKRRSMKIRSRETNHNNHRRLVEKSGLGYIEIDQSGAPKLISELHINSEDTVFIASKGDE